MEESLNGLAATAVMPKPFCVNVIPAIGDNRSEAPSIFFVSLPKSGTVYTWNMLTRCTGLKIPDFHKLQGWDDYTAGRDFSCGDLYACGDYNTQLLRPEAMPLYMTGFVFGGHMQASFHNMRVLKETGIDRIAVLLRDPRDAFVSWVHHLRTLGPKARDYHSRIYHWPMEYYAWTLEKQFSYQIRTFLPVVVNWIEGWLDYFASKKRDLNVKIVYYDELKTRPQQYIRRLVEFYGCKNFDLSVVESPKVGEMHYRKGQHGQWQEEFSAPDQRLVAELMQDRLLTLFDKAAASHEGISRAKSELENGRPAAACGAALRALRDFPNYRAGYELAAASCRTAGIAGNEAEALVQNADRQLGGANIADVFLYRYDLIHAVENVTHLLQAAE